MAAAQHIYTEVLTNSGLDRLLLDYHFKIIIFINFERYIMNNFDRYLSDINPKMLEDIAKKRRLKNTIMDVLGGFILFLILGLASYYLLNITI